MEPGKELDQCNRKHGPARLAAVLSASQGFSASQSTSSGSAKKV